jgi:AcrR family transcriptional regulator
MVSESKAAGRRRKLKDALISAAERTIESEGLRGLKARELAYKVGCAVGAIYNVVTDLEELIYAVNARTLVSLEAAVRDSGVSGEATESPDDAASQLVRLALAYTDFAAANQPRWRAIFQHQPPEGRETPDWYIADQMRLFSYVEQPLRVLLPKASAERRALVARTLFSAVHGMVVLGLEEKLQFMPLPVLREQVTLLVTAMAKGLESGAK